MKNLLTVFLTIIFIGTAIQAQQSSSNDSTSQGEKIEDTPHGYSFTAPAGWSSEKSEGKCAGVILSNPAETINIVVKPHHSNSLANFYKNESNLTKEDLKQVGDVRSLANNMKYIRFIRTVTGGEVLLDLVFIPFSEQGGAVVMSFAPTEALSVEGMEKVVNIVKSLRYSAPPSTGQSQPQTYPSPTQSYPSPSSTSPSSSYNSLFAGKRYYYENPRSGFQRRVDFCSSGTFEMNEVTSYGITETKGRWSVQQSGGTVYLIMVTSEGQSTFPVSQGRKSGNLVVDGFEYSVSNGSCR